MDPASRSPPPAGLPVWVGQSYGVVLILGDFFLGRRLVQSFDAFTDGGLSGIGDPFAWMMLLGLAGWWVVVLGRPWTTDPPVPMPTGAAVTALVVALVTSVLIGWGLGQALPALAITQGEEPNALGIAVITALILLLTALQWWRLQAWDPVPEVPDPSDEGASEAPEKGSSADSQVASDPPSPPRDRPVRQSSPAIRLAAALLLLPAGWALMAPGDLLALRAQVGIATNWQGTLEQLGAAALAAVFSAGFGMLLAWGPRALAARVLGEGPGTWRFLSGLWLSHWIRMALPLLGL